MTPETPDTPDTSAATPAEPRSTFERALHRRTDELVRSQSERAADLAQHGLRPSGRRRVSIARLTGIALALLAFRLAFCGAQRTRGNEPIGAAAVATADGAGVGTSASTFLPAASEARAAETTPAPSPTPQPSPDIAPPPRLAPRRERPRASAEHARGTAPTVTRADDAPLLVPSDSATDSAAHLGATPATIAAKPPAAVVNIGTRVNATLEAPLRTGAALAPATAVLAEDVRVSDGVTLKAGTRLVGSAFATPHDDRVQIIWRALIHDGRTLALQAETLGADGAPGVAGTVIRRHRRSVARRIGGALASAAGEVAGSAVPYGDSALEQAGGALAGRAGREMGTLGSGREWLQSDTVIALKAGTPLVVSLGADLTLGPAGER